ncbi:MAG: DUF4870 domain-containing protein [Terriglobales bacterium]
MAASCLNCGAQLRDSGQPCPVCEPGQSLAPELTLADRLTGAFAYFTFIPATVFLLLGRYKAHRFIRFHSFQSIFLTALAVLLAAAFWSAFAIFSFVPFLVAPLLGAIACAGCLLFWIVLLVKAFQGRKFKFPWIGDLAERLSGRES